MKILLTENIKKLGNIGDVINVKNGYARNYLFIQKKAIRLTKENKENLLIETNRIKNIHLEKNELILKHAQEIQKNPLVFVKQAENNGRLYGSVTSKDIARLLKMKFGIQILPEHIIIEYKIKEIGFHKINIELYKKNNIKFQILVSKSKEEAQKILSNEKL